jgi:hypothetical protein
MNHLQYNDLKTFEAGDLETYADGRAAEIGLVLPPAYRASILENLEILRGHARILAGAETSAS